MGSLERALREAVEGEVRFDRASRALYSSDAGVYQIIPTGVVIPRSRDDVLATLRICREHGVSITARGGGTSQSGQTLGPGIQLDFSKYMRRILEVDPAKRTVRVEPGIVAEELNHHLRPYGLELPLDLSTANRATLGGMIANNSSGTRSIVYGTTLDYVLELEVLVADGSVVTMAPLEGDELEEKCARDDLEGRCYRTVRELAAEHAGEIERRYPKIFRRVGGYNLDRFVPYDGPNDARASDGESGPPTSNGLFGSPGPFRSPGPFDLSKIIVGSEGTLGLVLEAKLRLTEPPGAKVLCAAQFRTLRDALEATPAILAHEPSAVELLDRELLELTRGKPDFEPLRDFIVGDPGAVLLVEFMGESFEKLPGRIDRLETDLEEGGRTTHVHRALEPGAQARIWKLRKAGLGIAMSERGDTKRISFVEDTAVAPERLAEYVDRFQEILDRHGSRAIFYAHASVGLLHIRPGLNTKTVQGVRAFQRIAEEVAELVLEFGGALSGEHGDGLVRSPFQEKMFGPVLYQAFRRIKETFDESGVLNPGKIVDPPSLTDNLQYGEDYRTDDSETVFDFSDFHGISRAAEQCVGVGSCRKTLTGTMCPSYMATREEADSTRGRANALRLALSGQLGPLGLADPALYPVLDLCLECKACKSECPTGVDMARLKSEFLHRYQAEHGATLRSRILAAAERTAVWGSRLAPVSNWLLGNPLSRWKADFFLGIDRRRRLPRFSRRTFLHWWQAREHRDGGPEARAGGKVREGEAAGDRAVGTDVASHRVAIFADTFTNFYEPEHGVAAVWLAEALGLEVLVPPRVCCGRPLISKGFLDRARRRARATAETLLPLAEAGLPIVFCEPGCWSAVKDDHPLLLRGELREKAELVASACVTAEEWAESALAAAEGGSSETGAPLRPDGPTSTESRPAPAASESPEGVEPVICAGPSRILLHGHCHQKALVGTDAAVSLLSRIPGCQVVEMDSGCCGMAGSFGYEKEHYEVSRALGERRLFPAVRERERDTVVVAPGFSCRHQIRHFTEADAVSAVELLAGLISGR